jgi:hypothetical protein
LLIVRPFIDRCIELGILPPAADSYTIKWPDLFALSEKARVEVGKSRANALREYVTMPMAEAIIPPKAFLQYFLGFTQEQIELVSSMMEENMSEEELQDIIAKTIEMQTNPPVPAGPAADNKLKRTAKPKTESNG